MNTGSRPSGSVSRCCTWPEQGLQLVTLCDLIGSAVATCCAHLAWPPLDDQESVLAHSSGLLGVCQGGTRLGRLKVQVLHSTGVQSAAVCRCPQQQHRQPAAQGVFLSLARWQGMQSTSKDCQKNTRRSHAAQCHPCHCLIACQRCLQSKVNSVSFGRRQLHGPWA